MKRRELERNIEARAVREYVRLGAITRKMNGLGFRAWPDRLVIGLGFHFWIEFKRVGEECTPLQLDCHKKLRKQGEHVYVCDDSDEAIEIFHREDPNRYSE